MLNHQEETLQLMKETLQEDYLSFLLESFRIEENSAGDSRVVARVSCSNDTVVTFEGQGVGALDAFFLAMRERLSEDYPSVKALIFSSVRTRNLPGSVQQHPTDATAEVSLRTLNSYNDELEFVTTSRSFVRASLEAVVEAFQYFVNSERAYIRLYNALDYYRGEGRSELVDKYTSLLSQIVRNTSYSEVIERIKAGA
jgi:hypothetical protein